MCEANISLATIKLYAQKYSWQQPEYVLGKNSFWQQTENIKCKVAKGCLATRECVRQIYFWQQLDNMLKSILGNNQSMFEASILFGNKQKT